MAEITYCMLNLNIQKQEKLFKKDHIVCVSVSLLLLYTTQQHIATGYKPPPLSHSFSSKYCQSKFIHVCQSCHCFPFKLWILVPSLMVCSKSFLNYFSSCESARLRSQRVPTSLKGVAACCERLLEKNLLNRLTFKLEVLKFIPNTDEALILS